MAIWSRLTGAIVGIGVAEAGAAAIEPIIEPQRQKAWMASQARVLGVNTLARLIAQGLLTEHDAFEEAARDGYAPNRLQALVQLALEAPSVAEGLTLYRRKLITTEQLEGTFTKAQIEPQYWPALKATAHVLLSPAEVANAVQQGHLPNPGILPNVETAVHVAGGAVEPLAPDGQPPSEVPLTTVQLDPLEQAEGHGYSLKQLQVLANLAGLPPGAETLLAMWNRGLITEETVDAGIREGHLKTKWIGSFKRMRWAVLSAQEYASAALRTWVTKEQMYEGGALTGHTKAQMDLLFLNRGRPASPTQMWRAWARGVNGPRGVPTDYEDHAKAISISDIRPEYAELLWDSRFNYPSMFQLNRLAAAGTISAETAADWAHKSLYAPEVVDALRKLWAHGDTASSKAATKAELADEYEAGYLDEAGYRAGLAGIGYEGQVLELELHLSEARRAKRYREKVVDAVSRAYVAHKIDDATAGAELAEVGVTGPAAAVLVGLWQKQRRYTVALLSPAQVKKAYSKGLMTQEAAIGELEERGYSPADAAILLAS